jgi:hypothetical protein
MNESPNHADPDASEVALSRELTAELWARIARRLRHGEILVKPVHFQRAMESEYQSLTGKTVTAGVRERLRQIIAAVNTRHPEIYVAQGVQNGVRQSFTKGVFRLQWDEAKVQARGTRSIQRFNRCDRIRDLLEEVDVRPDQIDVLECVQHSLRELQRVGEEAYAPVLSPAPAASRARAAASKGNIDEPGLRQRLEGQTQRYAALMAQEMGKVVRRLPVYVAQGRITAEEAESVRVLRLVNERVQRKEIDEAEADFVRDSLLRADLREALEKKIGDAVDKTVRYLQVFEGMRKIGTQTDPALAFLIRHKDLVVSADRSRDELAGALQDLNNDPSLLQGVIALAEGKDREISAIAARLPPYSYVMGQELERVAPMSIQEDFLVQLRHLGLDEVSERLHAPDKNERVRPATDMRCLISLIDHVTRGTAFGREIRLLKISQNLEEYYRNTPDLREARQQAGNYFNRQLRQLCADLSAPEIAELEQRGQELLEDIEHKVQFERWAAGAVQRQQDETTRGLVELDSEDAIDTDLELTEPEKKRGALVDQVEMRISGTYRRISCKIIPDPDQPDRFVIATRDPGTGELQPQLYRDVRHFVVRDRDGVWRPE